MIQKHRKFLSILVSSLKDGKIAFVGEKTKALKLKGNNTQIKDLQGKALLPGFIDPHCFS